MPERDNERARAEAMDRLLARTLRQTQQAGGADCPEPDILAAYSERSLTDSEAQRWEKHFSACSRCQQTLAALVGSETETPLAASERVARAHPAISERPPSRRTTWRTWPWWMPAAAVAAAVVLWIIGKPASPWKQPVTLTAQEAPSRPTVSELPPDPKNPEERAENVSPAKKEPRSSSALGEEGRAEKPGPDLQARLESPRFDRPRISPGPRKQPPPSESDHLRREDLSRSVAPAPVNPEAGRGGGASGQQKQELAERDKSFRAGGQFKENTLEPSARPQGQEKQTPPRQPTKDADVFAKAKAPAPTTAPSPEVADQANAEVLGKRSNLAEKKGSNPARLTGGPAQTVGATIGGVARQLIWSPTGSVRWRIGAAGRIERSTDGGASWQPQRSGVTADLSAGAAPSESVCWVVGRTGTILRTTDGEHWEKIAPPATLDWTRVRAQDALHAGISARDDGQFRHFVTEDGGKTWQAILHQ